MSQSLLCEETFAAFMDVTGDASSMIIQVFLSNTEQSVQEALTAAAAGDHTTVRRHAHSIKSSAAQIGVMDVSDLAALAEQHAMSDNVSCDILMQDTAALETAFDAVKDIITSRIA